MPRYKNNYYTKEEKIRICKKVINGGKIETFYKPFSLKI